MPDELSLPAAPGMERPDGARRSAREIERWLVEQLADLLEIAPEAVDARKPFTYFGLGSAESVLLAADLEDWLGVTVEPTVTWDYPTIRKLARFLARPDASVSTGQVGELDRQDDREMEELLRARLGIAPASLPVSHGQRALWYLHQLAPDSAAYNLMYLARLRGNLDAAALRRALKLLLDRHPILRTTYGLREGQPVQRIHAQQNAQIEEITAAGWSKARLDQRVARAADEPFDLEHGPVLRVQLFRRSARTSLLLVTIHHIAADMWSLGRLVDELLALYVAAVTEAAPALSTLAPIAHEHADYVAWQRQVLAGPEGERQWAYWQEQLRAAPLRLDLPGDRQRPPVQTYSGATVEFALDAALWRKIVTFARRAYVTPFIVLLAAFQVLLFRYTGQEDLIVGCPMLGRTRAGLGDVIGYLTNPVPLRTNLAGEPTFRAVLRQVRETVRGALEHQDYPLPLLVERLQPARDPAHSPLFQVAFAWEWLGKTSTASTVAAHSVGLSVQTLEMSQRGAPFDLTLMAIEEANGCRGVFQYNTDLFEAAMMTRMAQSFQTLLAEAVADADRPVASLPLLTAAERRGILQAERNAGNEDRLRSACIHHLFEEQAARMPDAPAVVCSDAVVTYRTLQERSEQLAATLRALGIGPEARVAVLLDRSPELVVALLAILKAGGAYVPLDPAYPHERLAFMLADADAAVVLTQRRLLPALPTTPARVLSLDDPRLNTGSGGDLRSARSVGVARPEQLAYVMYTSGSTGQPKGVAIEHRSVVNLVRWARNAYTPEELAGVLASTSIGFDLSVFELFVPLCSGGTVILADTLFDAPRLVPGQARLINTVPSLLLELLKGSVLPRSVRTVNLAGEPCPEDLVRRLFALGHVERVLNLYGPTEATVYATAAEMCRDAKNLPSPVPIGEPVANIRALVLDAQMQPVPASVIGELYLGGAGLARGYWNRPDWTRERFVSGPSSAGKDGGKDGGAGERLYRTGDLVRRRLDGALVYIGRADQQVKLRGVRIELEELEAALRRHSAVAQAAVALREHGNQAVAAKELVAYVVLARRAPGPDTDQTGIIGELRRFLRASVPEYMVPSAFVLLDALPLTPSGKVDRRSLPPADLSGGPADVADRESSYIGPRTPLEGELCAIWAEVLGLPQVGVYDNFFELGGVSLQALDVISRLHDHGFALPPEALLQCQTVAELAALVESEYGHPTGKRRGGEPGTDGAAAP